MSTNERTRMPDTKLTAYELSVLPAALDYAKSLKDEKLTRDGLKAALSIGSVVASHLQAYILEINPAPAESINEKASVAEVNDVEGDKWTITLPRTRISTLEELLAHCKVDLGIWEVERFICNKWEMGYKNKAEEADYQELFQIKAFLRRKIHAVNIKLEIEQLKVYAKETLGAPAIIFTSPQRRTGNLLEV